MVGQSYTIVAITTIVHQRSHAQGSATEMREERTGGRALSGRRFVHPLNEHSENDGDETGSSVKVWPTGTHFGMSRRLEGSCARGH
jgi:hypothetical protein